jgi:hypothetical protein
LFYPDEKTNLPLKGTLGKRYTFAIKKINMAVTKSANINWVKDIYIEQEFEVQNDSVFLLTRDYDVRLLIKGRVERDVRQTNHLVSKSSV